MQSNSWSFSQRYSSLLGNQGPLQSNPDFLLEIVKEYIALCPAKPTAQGQPPAPQLQHCASVLDTVIKIVPELLQGIFLLAKVRFQSGDY
ncbi:hypothetical protein J4Q44_G00200060 [Coregonus suidteri]|uniref:Tetratricopeptide repeat protein 21A/21B second ARM domain-containing protein n=1 Tax=Coregonus suidteri TaxID=861788 RepID=A0AAN8LFN2_9TELE